MAISIKEFENDSFFTSPNSRDILEFLKKNPTKAYTSKEISEGIGKSSVSVSVGMKRLIKGGFVIRNHPYIALASRISETKLKELRIKTMNRRLRAQGKPLIKIPIVDPLIEGELEVEKEIPEETKIIGEAIPEVVPEVPTVPEEVPEEEEDEEEFPEED